MSKKQLLNESEIRRFMKLANLEPLAKNVLSEMHPAMDRRTMGALAKSEAEDPMAMSPDASMDAPPADMGGEEEIEVEVGDDVDPEKRSAFEAAVQALADAMGIDVELESQEEHDEEGGEEMHDLDGEDSDEEDAGDEGGEEEAGGEDDELDEAKEEEKELDEAKEEEKEEEEGEEKKESKKLSEDELVETVLARVTARLVAEAKKKKKDSSVKAKMKAKKDDKKKKEDKKDVMEEATDSKGGGPLLSKGGNKHDTYKGHTDMAYAKGKEGKGGHQMEVLPAKAEHTVTHGGKNLATLGGNKKKV